LPVGTYTVAALVPTKRQGEVVEVLAAVVAVIKEVLEVVRAALASWPVTARLCVILVVVAATTCTTGLVLR
jgi:hypothetical protein